MRVRNRKINNSDLLRLYNLCQYNIIIVCPYMYGYSQRGSSQCTPHHRELGPTEREHTIKVTFTIETGYLLVKYMQTTRCIPNSTCYVNADDVNKLYIFDQGILKAPGN